MVESTADNKEALVIDLSFVPTWARKPPAAHGVSGGDVSPRVDRPREQRSGPPRHAAGGERPASGNGTGRRREFRDRGRRSSESAAPGPARVAAPDPRLKAIEIAFLPERHGLAPLAHRLARSTRAYSLFEVAALFLSKPEFHAVKLTVTTEAPPAFDLHQCGECKAVFLEKEAVGSHAFARHFDRYCRKEEKDVEPPKGNFVCVARCGLSGVLIGPPNYHSYNDRVQEIHRTRYPGMPIEAYRQRIETSRDPALIDRWKDEMKRQVTYHFGEGAQAVSFTRFAEAEAWFREHCMEEILKSGRHFVLPGSVVKDLEDTGLRQAIEEAVQQESRFPLKLSIALRLAFRHLGLHTFKTGGGHTFLTAVAPNAIDPSHAVPVVRAVLARIAEKPGCTRQEVTDYLAGAPAPAEAVDAAPAPERPSAGEVATQLNWLVGKGHVIEFSDGRLAVPRQAVARVQAAHPHGHPHGDVRHGRHREGEPRHAS